MIDPREVIKAADEKYPTDHAGWRVFVTTVLNAPGEVSKEAIMWAMSLNDEDIGEGHGC